MTQSTKVGLVENLSIMNFQCLRGLNSNMISMEFYISLIESIQDKFIFLVN